MQFLMEDCEAVMEAARDQLHSLSRYSGGPEAVIEASGSQELLMGPTLGYNPFICNKKTITFMKLFHDYVDVNTALYRSYW